MRLAVAIGFLAAGLLAALPVLAAADESGRPNPAPGRNAISTFNQAVERGAFTPSSEPTSGYLRSVLEYLGIPIESQMLVFSQSSFQAKLINQENPRAIYFNDDVALAWVRGASSIEAAAVDPATGTAFYRLENGSEKPLFRRDDSCLSCHQSHRTVGVPGLFVLSTPPDSDRGGFVSDHRTPFTERWGGWYVTGLSRRFRHLGNRTGQGWLQSLYDQFDTSGYLTESSDIVALMTFEHQTQAINLLTRLSGVARTGESGPRFRDAVNSLVDYLLFIDEAALPSRIIPTSGFREKFEVAGPYDRRGRSLRQFDLSRRMMRYPCSYMIYSKAFDALPSSARQSVYARMWNILAGRSGEAMYARMPLADRQAVIEILRDTKSDLPRYWGAPESSRVSAIY
ncbi:MAG TPA: hypothetical protein VIY49_38190 [Bryobacteraceae bacterium]